MTKKATQLNKTSSPRRRREVEIIIAAHDEASNEPIMLLIDTWLAKALAQKIARELIGDCSFQSNEGVLRSPIRPNHSRESGTQELFQAFRVSRSDFGY